jgi:hypothetical protein
MAPKKKPITLGKGTGYTKPVTPDKPGRPVSPKPGQASKNRAAAKTTSSGITRRPDGRAQSEGRSGRQSISRAQVTSGSNGKPTGAAASRVTMSRGMAPVAKAAATLGTIRSMMSPAGAAMSAMAPRPLAKGTLTAAMKRGDYKPRQGPAVPQRLTQGGMDKGSFNSAFKASRSAGKKEFTWRGKKYNTKLKGE